VEEGTLFIGIKEDGEDGEDWEEGTCASKQTRIGCAPPMDLPGFRHHYHDD
jgi:hypothetical protein